MNVHTLILGQTESGKSTLGKMLARRLRQEGRLILVCDPVFDTEWPANRRFDCLGELSDYAKRARACHIFIDEAADGFAEDGADRYRWLTSKSRHWGHSVYLLSPRGVGIPKSVRDNCSRLYLFTSSVDDGKIHAAEWNKPELASCNQLRRFEFFAANRYELFERLRIVDRKAVAHGHERDGGDRRRPGRDRVDADPGGAVDSTKGRER